jgi:hypothetical protein
LAKPQPWTPADATDQIRAIAANERTLVSLILTQHAREQMAERSLYTGDVLFILKQGFVLGDAVESTRAGYYKYAIQSRSPNSGNRTVRLIVIPDPDRGHMKIVTVMWADN